MSIMNPLENVDSSTIIKNRQEFFRLLLIYGLVSIVVIVMAFPLLWVFRSSFTPSSQLFQRPPPLVPADLTLVHYRALLNETNYLQYLQNSLFVAITTSVVSTIAATMAAYSLTRFRYPLRGKMATSLLVLYLLPPIMLVVPLFITFKFLGLNNTLIGVALGHITYALPFTVWFLRAYFESIPITYEEAAMCEGASRFQAIRKVVLPIGLPGIVTAALFSFTVSWNDYLFAFTFISSNNKRTLTLALNQFAGTKGLNWGVLMATAVLIALPPLIAIVFVRKHLLEGFGIAS